MKFAVRIGSRSVEAFDLGTEGAELLDDALIAAINMVDAVNDGLA